jgi:hypothetical protein
MHQPAWKSFLDIVLVPIALFRIVVGYSVDVAMAFKYPMALDGCATACSSRWCAFNCELRSILHLDLSTYMASGVDPVSAALGPHIRFMTGFYFLCVAPFMMMLLYAIWTKNEAIRLPAIVVGGSMAALMIALITRTIFGTPPSTSVGLFFLYNIVDVIAPMLILIRFIPQPAFAAIHR